jgi:lipopolysaccharide exporter
MSGSEAVKGRTAPRATARLDEDLRTDAAGATATVHALPNIDTIPRDRRTSFGADVLKLVSGTTAAQALSILAAPLMTRLYAPAAYGTLALFTSITSVLGVIACMRYEFSIMLPASDEEATNLLALSLAFAALVSALTIPVIWWGREPLLEWLNAPQLWAYLWLVPPAVFVAGVFLALNYWNSRTKHFARLSVARVTSAVATTSAMLGAACAGHSTAGAMIAASVGGQAVTTTVLGAQIWRDHGKLFLRTVRWREMLAGLKRHRKFPVFSTGSALLNTASWQLPALLLFRFFSSTIVGYYALGFRILHMPMTMMGAAIAQVFFQRAAEAHVEGTLSCLVESTLRRLVMIGLFPMLTLTIVGRDLFAVVFGSRWVEAGVYTQMLGIWALVWFVASPLSTLFIVLEKQELYVMWDAVNFATRLVSLGIGGAVHNPRVAILLFASSGVVTYGCMNLMIAHHAGVPIGRIARILRGNLAVFLPAGVVLVALSVLGVQPWVRLGTACGLGGLWVLYLLTRQRSVLLGA